MQPRIVVPAIWQEDILEKNPNYFKDLITPKLKYFPFATPPADVDYIPRIDVDPSPSSESGVKDPYVNARVEQLQRQLIRQVEENYRFLFKRFAAGTGEIITHSPNGHDSDITLNAQSYLGKIRYTYSADDHLTVLGPALPDFVDHDRDIEATIWLDLLLRQDPSFAASMNVLSFYCYDEGYLYILGTSLTIAISNSQIARACALLEAGLDANAYAPEYGNTPLLLALTKGWNHIDSDWQPKEGEPSTLHAQRTIIQNLLMKSKLDINAMHAKNGMTALHIACYRGDDPELIKLLLVRGANPHSKDIFGRTPADLLNLSYETAQQITAELLDRCKFGATQLNLPENKSYTGTIPTRLERENNISQIRKLLADHEADPDSTYRLKNP